MKQRRAGGFTYHVYPGQGGANAGCILFTSLAQQPFDPTPLLASMQSTIVVIEIEDWDNDMTPWPAPGLYAGDPTFEGHASVTHARIVDELLPHLQRTQGIDTSRLGIAGYSLGGLFSLYSFLNDERFATVASMSGSLWYEGWLDYLGSLAKTHRDLAGDFAYLSIGDREKYAKEKILHGVEDNTVKTAEILRSWGMEVEYQLNPGNHFQNAGTRVADGLSAIDPWL